MLHEPRQRRAVRERHERGRAGREERTRTSRGRCRTRRRHRGARIEGRRAADSRRRETTGAPAKIVLQADRARISADGEDVAVVEVQIVDAQGRIVPTADNEVTFAVTGPGRIIGVGNGDPSSHEPTGRRSAARSTVCAWRWCRRRRTRERFAWRRPRLGWLPPRRPWLLPRRRRDGRYKMRSGCASSSARTTRATP